MNIWFLTFKFKCQQYENIAHHKKKHDKEQDQARHQALGDWREFRRRDDANAWRKSTKEADKYDFFYCNLESKNLSMHWRHHRTNSHQSSSAKFRSIGYLIPTGRLAGAPAG